MILAATWQQVSTRVPSNVVHSIVSLLPEDSGEMVGILVHGNNHFILSGPRPDDAAALALARHWSIIQIGVPKSQTLHQWQIRTKEFRENLEWAIIIPGDREISLGAAELLAELSARGVVIDRCDRGCW
jgi:hypothetical protein